MKQTDNVLSNWRWCICSLLFIATTINYLDRQVLSLTYEEFIKPMFHWTDADYGKITGYFSIFYAFSCLFAGKFIDWMGAKKGFIIAILIWSIGACMHGACGVATMYIEGFENMAIMRAVEIGSNAALAIATTGVYLFLFCRGILALGEAGNFPAAIKVTAEYFPKKDRALATSIFNAGASIGALVAPLSIPPIAAKLGWEMAFIIIGALGFIWIFFWQLAYDKPERSKYVNAAELSYINQDDLVQTTSDSQSISEKRMSLLSIFRFRQTWSFIIGKFLTDGVWWFFLFWAPSYFQNQFGYKASSSMGMALIFTVYAIVTILSIFGGYLPKLFVEKRRMEPYYGRMRAMLIFAFFPLCALLAQPLGAYSEWWPAILIGIAGAGHQAWSANLFSTVGDMFPKSIIATITGIGTMAGGIGSMLIQRVAGNLFTYAQVAGDSFSFVGFSGKPAGYFVMFCFCGIAYLVGWCIMKALVPKYTPVEL